MPLASASPAYGGRYAGQWPWSPGPRPDSGRGSVSTWPRAGATVIGLARSAERLAALLAPSCRPLSPGSGTGTCDVADTEALRGGPARGGDPTGPSTCSSTTRRRTPGSAWSTSARRTSATPSTSISSPRWPPPWPCSPRCRAGPRDHHQRLVGRGAAPLTGPGAYPSSKAALSAFSESTSFRL